MQLLLSDRVAIHCLVNTLSCQRTQHNVLAKVKPRPFALSQVVKSWVKITKDYYKNLISDLKAFKENSVEFFLSAIWLLDALKQMQKIIPKRLLNKGIKKHRLKKLAQISLQTTGSSCSLGCWLLQCVLLCLLQWFDNWYYYNCCFDLQDDGDETVSETGSESMLTDLNTEEGMKKIDKVVIRLSRLSVV